MNCKLGDIVRYVGRHYSSNNVYGWIGKTVKFDDSPDADGDCSPAWIVDPPLPYESDMFDNSWILDSALRPIRDPGDDAVDEFLALTGKPDYKQKIAEKTKERV